MPSTADKARSNPPKRELKRVKKKFTPQERQLMRVKRKKKESKENAIKQLLGL